jgi:hypothetical protein
MHTRIATRQESQSARSPSAQRVDAVKSMDVASARVRVPAAPERQRDLAQAIRKQGDYSLWHGGCVMSRV